MTVTQYDPASEGAACIVCWRAGTDRAHLIDRSLAPDPGSDPLRTVRLCRAHHDEYDRHELNLLPYLEPRHRAELAKAVEIHGLVSTLERVTGQHWTSTTAGAVRFELAKPLSDGAVCHECGGMMMRTGSCHTCPSCGANDGCG